MRSGTLRRRNRFFLRLQPSTREFTKLPLASHCTSGSGAVSAGLGYDAFNDEYVLIHLFDRSVNHGDYDIGCEILRFGHFGGVNSCEWRVVEGFCPCEVRGWGILVNNVFYWMVFDEYENPGDDAIIGFDLVSEEFGTVLAPKGCYDPGAVWFLVELKGELCLIDYGTRPFCMDIWMIRVREEEEEWVNVYSIELSGEMMVKSIVLLDYWNGEILIDVKQESVECYNVESKSVRRMYDGIEGDWTWLCLYTDSFFFLGTS